MRVDDYDAIRKGPDVWNAYRETQTSCEAFWVPDLDGANLARVDLAGADLFGADLAGADLFRADLTGANLRDANLHGANLHGANLTGALARRADLAGVQLRFADLTGADLTGADLTGAYLTDANLDDANLTGANLTGADLRDVRIGHLHAASDILLHESLFSSMEDVQAFTDAGASFTSAGGRPGSLSVTNDYDPFDPTLDGPPPTGMRSDLPGEADQYGDPRRIPGRFTPASRMSSVILMVSSVTLLLLAGLSFAVSPDFVPLAIWTFLLGSLGAIVGIWSYIYLERLIRESRARSFYIERLLAQRSYTPLNVRTAAGLLHELNLRQSMLLAAGEIRAAESLQATMLLVASRAEEPPRELPPYTDVNASVADNGFDT